MHKRKKKGKKKDGVIRVGSRVKYISDFYNESADNPKWGGKYGKVIGTVKRIGGGWMDVIWDNGRNNSYEQGLILASKKTEKKSPYVFVLKYDLDADPLEMFDTMEEVKSRVKVLVAQRKSNNLKLDSLVVYKVKILSEKKVKVAVKTHQEKVSIKGI